ncbi:MAG: hypothetical protein A2847_01425 [Candidatus Sungbacteria bacterium RIFCSPHIGHO2_01_FULL_50_25]|uniref:Glutamyl-tRNA amidotransferase n=1 Tax=Candidatus Sungbacteria bacterium RIFCSPHIGHO2_01_FULL_50_25 TaxID=1802265 RepID=A0A1G2KA38_9BACT|nr:MAG: hypothetical protein A2847_01425 [Candidatus Sungbacteria bacterium RIFCSPHIGHO2_01_FULL_50_25]
MGLQEQITEDIKHAFRNRDDLKLSALRMLSSAFHNRAIEKRGKGQGDELTQDELVVVLRSEVKKRRDAIVEFEKGSRPDLVEKEKKEFEVLEAYLPKEMDDDSLLSIARDAIKESGAASAKDFGRVMGAVMKRVGGQASGDRVSRAVKELLE